jgi:preprotein translocase subunit SecA
MVRQDLADVIYKTEASKFRAVVEEIKDLNEAKRPILVGTVSIEKSEELSKLLHREGIKHEVLNAKQHEREATIIAQAGRPGAVTIATNMAGRGVDILLGGNPSGMAESILRRRVKVDEAATEEDVEQALGEATELCERDHEQVVELGGLHIIGTERHEARRIDNQLRGRAGRQGDPGSSRFFLSLEDDLMRRFMGGTIANLMEKLGIEEDVPLEHSMVTKAIENAQEKVESYNFDLRKHVVEYDDVMNRQREIIYGDRRAVLGEDTLRETLQGWVEREIEDLCAAFFTPRGMEAGWEDFAAAMERLMPMADLAPEEFEGIGQARAAEALKLYAGEAYALKEQELGPEVMRQAERVVVLRIIDSLWVRHLTALDDLRNGIGLRAYGQRDPLVEYKVEAARMFDELLRAIQHDVAHTIFHVKLTTEHPRPRPQQAVMNRGSGQPVRAGRKIGRNDPCYCGSGRKYKFCCGR